MKNLVALLVLAFTAFLSHGQTIQITGNVSDPGGPLPGAIVLIKGTATGTQTDFDGNFSIDAEKGETLVFSYLGYRTKSVKIKDVEKLEVRMREDETVCFAPLDYYLPFKIYELDSYDENWQTTQDIGTSLSKIPSVQVSTANAFTNTSIRIRGDHNTIVIVDGIRCDASILNTLNPVDIEHIAVATSAAASNYLRIN